MFTNLRGWQRCCGCDATILVACFQMTLAHFCCNELNDERAMKRRRTTTNKKNHLKNLQNRRQPLNFLWIRSCIFVIIAIYSWLKMKQQQNKTANFILSCKSFMLWLYSHILWFCYRMYTNRSIMNVFAQQKNKETNAKNYILKRSFRWSSLTQFIGKHLCRKFVTDRKSTLRRRLWFRSWMKCLKYSAFTFNSIIIWSKII